MKCTLKNLIRPVLLSVFAILFVIQPALSFQEDDEIIVKTVAGKKMPAFADIFRINAVKNGLLTIELPENILDELFSAVEMNSGLRATVDLAQQEVVVHSEPSMTSESARKQSSFLPLITVPSH